MAHFLRSLRIVKYTFDHSHSVGDLQKFPRICLGYVLEGSAEVLYKGRIYTATPGDIIYIAKGTTYYSIWHGKPKITFYSMTLEFADPYAKQEYEFQIAQTPALRELFDRIYEASRGSVSFSAIGYTYFLFEKLYPLLTPHEGQKAERPVLPAILYLEQHYTEKTDVALLARLCGFSESRFFSLFKRATNCTPIQYKNNILVQHALELLTETTLSVEEISRILGFSSPSYFRRVFRSVTNQTPKTLRNNK